MAKPRSPHASDRDVALIVMAHNAAIEYAPSPNDATARTEREAQTGTEPYVERFTRIYQTISNAYYGPKGKRS